MTKETTAGPTSSLGREEGIKYGGPGIRDLQRENSCDTANRVQKEFISSEADMVDKGLKTRSEELRLSLESLKSSLMGIQSRSGSSQASLHIHNMMPQLRQLIADGGRNFRPRLLNLADEMRIPLRFYAAPEEGLAFTLEIKLPDSSDTVFSPTGYAPNFIYRKCWSPMPRQGFVCVDLREWMQREIYDDSKVQYTRNNLLRAISDKEGGGHLDDTQDQLSYALQEKFLCFDKEDVSKALSGKDIFLIDLAALVIWLGQRMLLMMNCHARGLAESVDEGIAQPDAEFDSFQAQYSNKFGWVIPRADSWGLQEAPPSGQVKIRLILSRKQDWYDEPHVYTNLT